jgi:anti-sigma factor RsiW
VTQQANEHYTNEELSAYLDKELTVQEMTVCATHLQTCAICRALYADLQLISSLLHALPQEPVSHNFTLPIATLQTSVIPPLQILDAPVQMSTARKPDSTRPILRRTMRAVSTLVALVGLVLLLSSFFASYHGTAGTSASNTSRMAPQTTANQTTPGNTTGSQKATRTVQQGVPTPEATPTPEASSTTQATANQTTATPTKIPTAQPTVTATSGRYLPVSKNSGPSNPPLIDFSQPATRLLTGFGLLLLGLVGYLVTRKKTA